MKKTQNNKVKKDKTDAPYNVEVDGLFRIAPKHAADLKRLFTATNSRAWCCFTPFLYFTSNPTGNCVYWTELDGTPVILYRKPKRNVFWELYTLCADSTKTAMAAIDIARQLSGGNEVRVMWLPEDQIKRLVGSSECSFIPRDSEYILDSHAIAELKGGAFRELRKRINRFERENEDISIEPLSADDAADCMPLLENWKQTYSSRGYAHPLVDHFYTKGCLENFSLFNAPDLFGWAAWRDDEIVGVSIAGEMGPGLANFFALKCRLDIQGLSVFLRHYSISRMAEMGYSSINDASDLNAPGLARHKSMFNPIEKLNIYRAGL